MTLPSKNIEYGTKEYWDHRYSQHSDSATFDWFKSYAEVAHLIREYVPDKSSKILMLGCGNSSLSEDMWQDGYKNIVNIDYSSVVIQQMKQKYGSIRPGMEWHEMDVRALSFGNASFDVAIDKGTMDAMMASEINVWDPPTQVVEDCTREVHEVMR
ncbi:hypothetical protein SERLA73DRAFT_75577 [Serpula lacrymans var. lacrymans S7.3]|uniref:Methyltransferase domain-containing protein n=1 Tax=Serpula lacrymans var. lacrymans (strain S7.3) TaxID=936435 RepID=F8Q577_SERL3|nr:hypothetical protein SERLA73DRAFT_75577 [Serpula lacrymans var. lacrymans S7.3]